MRQIYINGGLCVRLVQYLALLGTSLPASQRDLINPIKEGNRSKEVPSLLHYLSESASSVPFVCC